jgi:hypothetical protein
MSRTHSSTSSRLPLVPQKLHRHSQIAPALFSFLLLICGCATPPEDTTDYGPYPTNYETIVAEFLKPIFEYDAAMATMHPWSAAAPRPVLSMTSPQKHHGFVSPFDAAESQSQEIAGWSVTVAVSDNPPTAYRLCIRDGKVVGTW